MPAHVLDEARLRRILLCGFVAAVFLKLFFFEPYLAWEPKYVLFNVPAFTYPGADARNIQVAAHCKRAGYDYFGRHACLRAAEPVRRHHPQANVPVLNYPSHWPRLYGLFGDDSERFFMAYWRLNALLLLGSLVVLCWRYQAGLLPLLAFSPITVLTVERGNNDAITFFFTFMPLLLFARSIRVQAFFVGFAAALKIFPAAGAVAFLRPRPPFVATGALVGALCAAPLVIVSILELPYLLAGTARGFLISYGLPSLKRAPVLEDYPGLVTALTAAVVVAMAVACVVFWRSRTQRAALEEDLRRLAPVDLTVLAVSAGIFLATFLLFSSWAYRLIFLIPALLVLARGQALLAKLVCLNVLAVFWIPFLRDGWLWLNFACYPLALMLPGVLVAALRQQAAVAGAVRTASETPG